MNSWKKIFTNTRVIITLIFILFALFAINPHFSDGVAIRTVAKDSLAAEAQPAFQSAPANARPTQREVIYSINGKEINNVEEYYSFLDSLEPDKLLLINTNKGVYELTTRAKCVNETEVCSGIEDLGIGVYDVASNNIRQGLDLEGGTRVILEPEEEIDADETNLIVDNIKQRLNVYGLSDLVVKGISDFDGKQYILVEIPGANQEEVRDLLANQGKFESKVGNTTVFKGGNDILDVCRRAECSGIDPRRGCGQIEDGTWVCGFRFSIVLSNEAAQAQADATRDLEVISTGAAGEGYLSQNISLFLDDELFDELRISEGLKGNALTEISITGSGAGLSEQAAALDALDNMRKLQTVLITGSLPVKLNIAQADAISPVLGEEFIRNALLVGFLSLAGVVAVVLIRYRKPIIAIPIIVTMCSEIIILLGFAALVGWRLDLAAIAGILIAVGTGVDDQIVIVDETLDKKNSSENLTWLARLKRAFFIIMTAYFTTVVAMLPLMWSGAGLLKGFALTTIVGVSIGVFITRPVFAAMMEILVEKNTEE